MLEWKSEYFEMFTGTLICVYYTSLNCNEVLIN